MATKLDVWNLALSFLDLSSTIQSENDPSPAAGAARRFYGFARKKVLERCFWDFATKTPALSLVLDQATSSTVYYPGWRYVYTRPNDCLKMLAVTSQYGLRANPFLAFWWSAGIVPGSWGPYRPPWKQALDQIAVPANQSINILTDQPQAYAVYVTDVSNVNLWTESFKECVAWQMAVPMAGPLSANNIAKKNAILMAEQSLTAALMVNLNESQPDPYPDSPAITARL